MTIFFYNIIQLKVNCETAEMLESVFLEIRKVGEMIEWPKKQTLDTSEESKEKSVQIAKYNKQCFTEGFLNIRAHLLKQDREYHKDGITL